MKFTKSLIRITIAAMLGLSLMGLPQVGTGTANAASAAVSSSAKATSVVNFAKSLRGKVTYKFNANTPSKLIFDCSSFTKYVFASQGVSLKWGSVAQSKQGKYVSKSNLKAGDLVFFSVSKKGHINHVGIYLGNGQFIHNTIGSHFNGLLISKLSSYSDRYITARRVL